MSAFIVEKCHINILVNAAVQNVREKFHYRYNDEWKEINSFNADEIGQILLDENIRSVSYRYNDTQLTDLPGRSDGDYLIPFKFQYVLTMPSIVQVLKLLNCYIYQACESNDWKETEAYKICSTLKERLITKLPGYDNAQWEWTEQPNKGIMKVI